MKRVVEPELLDELPPTDPGAIGSRRDLRRLNALMGSPRRAARRILPVVRQRPAARVIDLGAGDGWFLLEVARRLAAEGKTCRATLLDRQALVTEETRAAFDSLGWRTDSVIVDVFEWIRQPAATSYDVVVVNLLLHHCSGSQLSELLGVVSRRCHFFLAIEPRRCAVGWALSRFVGLVGCNAVTRHDAPASVRAGFRGRELSRLWPSDGEWRVQEFATGLFGHMFVAERRPS